MSAELDGRRPGKALRFVSECLRIIGPNASASCIMASARRLAPQYRHAIDLTIPPRTDGERQTCLCAVNDSPSISDALRFVLRQRHYGKVAMTGLVDAQRDRNCCTRASSLVSARKRQKYFRTEPRSGGRRSPIAARSQMVSQRSTATSISARRSLAPITRLVARVMELVNGEQIASSPFVTSDSQRR